MGRDISSDAEIERIIFVNGTGTSTPPSGYGYIYEKDGLFYFKNQNGIEYNLTSLHFLNDHTDVDTAGAAQSYSLIYDEGDGWEAQPIILNSRVIDVLASSPNDGDMLKWISASGAWVSQPSIYGSMFQDDIGTVISVSGTSIDFTVTGMSGTYSNGMTFQNGKEFLVLFAGKYKVDWSISFTTASATQEIEGSVGINDIRTANTSAHRRILTATDTGNFGGTGIINLSVNDRVMLLVRNETSSSDINIEHANIALFKIGV